ncbi:MAG: hypothetical protein K2K69_00155, partial [Muribaculaceae bacterium]|nr:hypothetical protein [Muribaculaceae bacterium]
PQARRRDGPAVLIIINQSNLFLLLVVVRLSFDIANLGRFFRGTNILVLRCVNWLRNGFYAQQQIDLLIFDNIGFYYKIVTPTIIHF